MIRTTLLCLALLLIQVTWAQNGPQTDVLQRASIIQLDWDTLSDVEFEFDYKEEEDVYYLKPNFGKKIQSFTGNKIRITGFFLNISGDGDVLLVSRNPMASCFYCGAAGPESVVEVNFMEQPSFKTDQIVTVTGILELNYSDDDHFNYILNEATGILDDR